MKARPERGRNKYVAADGSVTILKAMRFPAETNAVI